MIPPFLKMARNQKAENNNRLFQTELVDGYDNSNSGRFDNFITHTLMYLNFSDIY